MGDGGESCMFKDRWWRWLCGGTEAVDLPEPGDGGVGGGPMECGRASQQFCLEDSSVTSSDGFGDGDVQR